MDKITHEVRLSRWTAIVEACQNRPVGQTAKQWLADNGVSEKSYYYWQRKLRHQAFRKMQTEGAALPVAQKNTAVTFAEIPFVPRPGSAMPETFHPAVVIEAGNMVIRIANGIDGSLMSMILQEASHVK